jgi:uncharacterized protein YukE
VTPALAVGQSARALVPGKPDDLERLAARCGVLARGLDSAATRLRAVDAGEWTGEAGNAFRGVVDQEPDRYRAAAEAFAATGAAVRSYAAVLADAQAQAARAVATFEQAEMATAGWRRRVTAYDEAIRVRAERPAAVQAPDPVRPPHHDPGSDGRAAAARLLDDARERVRLAGDAAARRISAAWSDAPREPRWWEDAAHVVSEIGAGAWEATVGLAELAWAVSPVRMTVDPLGWQRDVTGLAEGLVYGVTHPVELGKAILDWDTWAESPGRAIGHLVPDLLLTLATGGAGAAARGARAAGAAEEMADMATTLRRLDRLEDTTARQGYFERARRLLHGRETPLPPPNLPPGSPAGQAAAFQGKGAYPGVDEWWSARMRVGDEVATGSVSTLPDLPFTGFAVPRSVADDVGGNARELFEGVQVQPYHGSYRDEVTVLRARTDVDVAVGTARSNPQFGPGGLRQVYVPDMQRLVDEGVLEVAERRPLHTLTARVGADDVPCR